jgi:hypothetical protein
MLSVKGSRGAQGRVALRIHVARCANKQHETAIRSHPTARVHIPPVATEEGEMESQSLFAS